MRTVEPGHNTFAAARVWCCFMQLCILLSTSSRPSFPYCCFLSGPACSEPCRISWRPTWRARARTSRRVKAPPPRTIRARCWERRTARHVCCSLCLLSFPSWPPVTDPLDIQGWIDIFIMSKVLYALFHEGVFLPSVIS